MNENLAEIQQWYEKDPSLLVAEKAAMAKAFPNFVLEQIGDGRLAWTGTLTPGIWKGFWAEENDLSARQTWEVMAIYEHNHPHQQMGSSVKVFLLYPTIETVIEQIGWTPRYLLYDPISKQKYLCMAQAEDVEIGETTTSAATVLIWALKWLTAFELVMTGDSKEDFHAKGKMRNFWGVAQMVAATEKGISQMYERGLKLMENAKTKVEYLQAADVFISIANSTGQRPANGDNEKFQKKYCSKSFALAHKCIESAEQCINDGVKEFVLKYSDGKEKKVNAGELCADMKKRMPNYIGAQRIFGNMCYKGEDVPQNYAEAFKWYEKMAEQGDVWAQNLVGLMCFNGTGVEENKEEAKKWLRKAAVQGYEPAKDMLQKLGE